MDEQGFIQLAKMLLQDLHDLRIEHMAMCVLLKKQQYITFEQLQSLKESILESPPYWDVETLIRDFRGPIQ